MFIQLQKALLQVINFQQNSKQCLSTALVQSVLPETLLNERYNSGGEIRKTTPPQNKSSVHADMAGQSKDEDGKVHCPCMSPVPWACAAVVLRYCQLRAARSMAADRYMGDRWWALEA